ncbi:MAG TPA: type II toxin-antitoxin system RelB/DinJ family antitoxin [Chloroflexota bacterium]|nr:type II toxin-antitoxin system RelB/DinJ family antitoxin [Chloroflexota bacterium]HUM68926.1 type II toxin-antitoxin system RelB/DinJ family antitoxin [Chloroflexota bacterium]
MAKTAVITTRIEPELKQEVETVLAELGLTTSQAMLLYFKQIALQQGIPFAVKIPNQDTINAIAEAREPYNLPGFDTIDDLFDALESE